MVLYDMSQCMIDIRDEGYSCEYMIFYCEVQMPRKDTRAKLQMLSCIHTDNAIRKIFGILSDENKMNYKFSNLPFIKNIQRDKHLSTNEHWHKMHEKQVKVQGSVTIYLGQAHFNCPTVYDIEVTYLDAYASIV